jgi:hypothetical protein
MKSMSPVGPTAVVQVDQVLNRTLPTAVIVISTSTAATCQKNSDGSSATLRVSPEERRDEQLEAASCCHQKRLAQHDWGDVLSLRVLQEC